MELELFSSEWQQFVVAMLASAKVEAEGVRWKPNEQIGRINMHIGFLEKELLFISWIM